MSSDQSPSPAPAPAPCPLVEGGGNIKQKGGFAASLSSMKTGAVAKTSLIPVADAVPNEILLHIFAQLEPRELKNIAGVCRRWRGISTDEGCWRMAFKSFFGSYPLRRIYPSSWRLEYVKRFKLMWNLGGRTRHVITYSPRFQQSDAMFVDAEEGRLFSGCIEEGIVAVCHYNTGKVEKDYMYSNSDFLRNPVSSVHVEKGRAFFGHISGKLSVVFDFHWKAATLRYFTGMHAAQLHLIKPFESSSTNEHSRNLILTSSFDRSLKIWSMDSFSCIATIPLLHFPDLPRFLVTDESSFITYSTEYGYSESFSLDISHISKAAATTTSAQPPPSTTATLLTPSTSNTRLLPRFLYVNPDTGSGNRHRHIDQQQRPRLLSSTLICNNRVIMFVSTLPVDHGGLVLVDAQSLQIIKFTTSSSLSTSSTLSSNRPDVNISSCYYCPGKAAPSPSSSSSADYSDSLSSPFSATTTETPPTAFASAVSEKPLLLLGHMNGAVSLVELPLVTFSSTSLSTPTLKTHILKGTHKASICRVVMDDFKICSMAIDGSIKSWDLMNGMLLATLHLKPGTRLRNMIEALDESLVGSQLPPDLCCQLWTSEFRVVACFGDTFKTWIFDPDYLKNTTQSSQKKKNLSKLASAFKSSASSSSSMSASPRSPSTAAQLRFAFKDDINDLSIQRESSEKDEARRRKLFEKLNGHLGRDILIGGNGGGAGVTGNKSPRSPSSIANMTEDELLQYVQILSMDDISLNQPMLSTSPNSLQQLEHHHMPINIHKAPPGPDLTVVDDSAFPPISPSSVGKSPLSAASITSNPWNRPMSNLVKSPSNSKRVSVMSPSISNSNDDDDLQYALELSMVEK